MKRSAIRAFLDGLASVFVWAPRKPRVLTGEEAARADAEALAGDWQHVGDDLRKAIAKAAQHRMTAEERKQQRRSFRLRQHDDAGDGRRVRLAARRERGTMNKTMIAMTLGLSAMFFASSAFAEDDQQRSDDEMYCRFYENDVQYGVHSPQDVSELTSVDYEYIGENPLVEGEPPQSYYAYSWRDGVGVVLRFSYDGEFSAVDGAFGFHPVDYRDCRWVVQE